MKNTEIIAALLDTGLVGTHSAFQTVIDLLKIQDYIYKAWPYVVKYRRPGNNDGKLKAVKDIKLAFDIGLKEAKDMADVLWPKTAPVKMRYKGVVIPYVADFQIVLDAESEEYDLLTFDEKIMQ